MIVRGAAAAAALLGRERKWRREIVEGNRQ